MSAEIQFWDGSKRRDWFMARAIARKIRARPEMLREIADCVEIAWASDPSKTRSLNIWRKLTSLSPEEFEHVFLQNSPEAEEARESFPPYVALTPAERADFIEAARREPAVI